MEKEIFLQKLTNVSALQLIGPLFLPGTHRPLDIPTLFVDGGFDNFEDFQGFTSPHLSVGDGDSVAATLDVNLPPEKDFTDLKFALDLIPPNIVDLQLWGFLGGRLDHQLAVFGDIHRFLLKNSSCLVEMDHHISARGAGRWELDVDGRFSLLCLSESEVSLNGDCKYRLPSPQKLAPLAGHGISNIGHGKIMIDTTGPIFIFQGDLIAD